MLWEKKKARQSKCPWEAGEKEEFYNPLEEDRKMESLEGKSGDQKRIPSQNCFQSKRINRMDKREYSQ